MREITFRAWDYNFREMLAVQDASFIDGKMIGVKGVNWDSKVEVMQYTGLKDKNGKEIYEGDILSWGKSVVAEVYWDNQWGWLTRNGEKTGGGLGLSAPEYVEVIGNIYENPELLNPQTNDHKPSDN